MQTALGTNDHGNTINNMAFNPKGPSSWPVDPSFREAYERYDAAFERKREDRATRGGWFGFLHLPWRKVKPQPQPQVKCSYRTAGREFKGADAFDDTVFVWEIESSFRIAQGMKASRIGTPVLEAAMAKDRGCHRTESI